MFVELKELRASSDSDRCDDDDEGLEWRLRTQWSQGLNEDQTQDLLRTLSAGLLLLDLSPRTWAGLMETLVDRLETSNQIQAQDRDQVLRALLLPHSNEDMGEVNGNRGRKKHSDRDQGLDSGLDSGLNRAALVLSGAVSPLRSPVVALVHLQEPVLFQAVLQVPVQVLVLSLGPTTNQNHFKTGRALASLLMDKVPAEAVSRTQDSEDLLRVLIQTLDHEDQPNFTKTHRESNSKEQDLSLPCSPSAPPSDPLWRSGTLFGGLLKDVRRRYPQYTSDLTDALNAQCVAAIIFIYFAALSPAVTFGGLLGEKTDGLMGVSELIIATALQGVVFAVVGAQPLLIVGFSGPLLVFEEAFYNFCQVLDVEYLTARLWVGLWLMVIVVVTVALEGSVLVRHVSRFTQEIFSVLISLIFIYETFVKLFKIFLQYPLTGCVRDNTSEVSNWWNSSALSDASNSTEPSDWSSHSRGVDAGTTRPNTALLSLLLMLGTYLSAFYLRKLKNSALFPGQLRRTIGDFGVPISIFIMVLVDYSIKDIYTQKLSVPSGVAVTSPQKRSWLVPPLGAQGEFPLWMAAASVLPALLVFILLFMESQITALIVSKRVVKGTGFHVDLLIIVLVGGVSALFGLPWLSAATVRSVTHANALSITAPARPPQEDRPRPLPEDKPLLQEEKPHSQEEKPHPQKEKSRPQEEKSRPLEEKLCPMLREQRVTGFVVALLVGLSVLVAGLLRQIPVSVLFGVFLYMGVMSLQGIQLTERIQLLLMPTKHHPKSGYVTKVRPWRLHLYTCLQITCLALLWLVMASPLALAFPFVLLLTVPLRKLLLPLLFTSRELQLLDGEEPEVELEQDEYEQLQMPV
ncbi:hypothetical protein NQD34_013182 [Periophthalmus magnuspinnatus]|nr:hypothetical protein NQD34_013182 [Periophthalmus magnuspinnatus]